MTMMNKGQFNQTLKLRCGNRKDANFDTLINLESSFVQQNELEMNGQFVPWFLESNWIPLTIVPGNESVTLPTDFLSEIEDQVLEIQYGNNVWKKLAKERYDEMVNQYGFTVGQPLAYSLQNGNILLSPPPDIVYPLRLRYFKRDVDVATLADAGTNLWLTWASDWLLSATGQILAAQHLHDSDLTSVFNAQTQTAKTRVNTIHEAREHTNRSYRSEG